MSVLKIPEAFWQIRYDQNHDPDSPELPSLSESPNCQNFAYALLNHFGHQISPFRSSDLWQDENETMRVEGELQPLDLLLFNRTPDVWGAHVALHVGGDQAIHLSKRLSTAVIWRLPEFCSLPEYQVFIGAKRLKNVARLKRISTAYGGSL